MTEQTIGRDLVRSAVATLLPGLRVANYSERWAVKSPAVQALSVLSEFVGEGPVQAGETVDPEVASRHPLAVEVTTQKARVAELEAEVKQAREDKVEFARWRDKWVADMQVLEMKLARSEDATEAAEAEVVQWRAAVATWSDLYREAVGAPPAEHQARRMEEMAAEWEQTKAEAERLRGEVQRAKADLVVESRKREINKANVVRLTDQIDRQRRTVRLALRECDSLRAALDAHLPDALLALDDLLDHSKPKAECSPEQLLIRRAFSAVHWIAKKSARDLSVPRPLTDATVEMERLRDEREQAFNAGLEWRRRADSLAETLEQVQTENADLRRQLTVWKPKPPRCPHCDSMSVAHISEHLKGGKNPGWKCPTLSAPVANGLNENEETT